MQNIYLPEKTGIYLVQNKINSHHFVDYKNKNNPQYDCKFYQALRKYGWDNFEITILELCSAEELDKREIEYIDLYDSFENGYNGTRGGQFWSPNIHSPEIEAKRKATCEKNKSLMAENHPRAKLSNEEVLEIRQRYIDGETYKTVGNIPTEKDKIVSANRGIKLTEDQVREIRKRYNTEHISYAKLGKDYNVSASTIQKAIRREGYYSYID